MTSDSPAPGAGRPLRVLLVAIRFPEVAGGVDAMVRDLIAALGPRAEVEVFVPGEWSDRRLVTARAGAVPRHTMRLRMPFDRRRPLLGFLGWLADFPAALGALVRLLRDGRFDLVHLHTVTNYAACFRLAGRLAGVPYVVTLHGSDVTAFDARHGDERWLIRWALAGAAGLVAVSAALARAAEARFGLAAAPAVIRNGIDLDLIGAAVAERPAVEIPEGRFVLSAGALDHVKGHDVLIRAWSRLAGQFPDTSLVIAGTGDEDDALRRLAGQLGCAGSIRFTGALPRAAVLQLMRRAALFVLPSREEGLGLVLLEAGLAGCPVVATAVGGVGEIVDDGETGLLVPPEDPAALAAAIGLLLGDGGQRATQARALGARVRAEFSSRSMADAYLRIYRRAAGRG
jgi:glycosyltransferase involved in cell wall biosynthesis